MLPAGADLWSITLEDRAKYDAQFAELMPTGGYLSGEQAKNFFLKSGLPPAVLGQIWGLADLTADGRMDRKEFAIAMLLIKRKLQGCELPRALPRSMLAEPAGAASVAVPVMMVGPMAVGGRPVAAVPLVQSSAPPLAMGFGGPGIVGAPLAGAASGSGFGGVAGIGGMVQPMPGLVHASPARVRSDSTGNDWAVPASKKLVYMQTFNREDRMRSGYLSGYEGGRILAETGLPKPILAKIWELSDVDGDGRLTPEEFCVAMHLADAAQAGVPPPMALPPELVPPQFRQRLAGAPGMSRAVGIGDASSTSGDPLGSATEEPAMLLSAEDRRRENFARGNQELERRRQEMRAQQKREEEERLAKERAEAEKREQARLEQERKKQQELERQLERQRQQEAEREERRRQAMEAREAARREVERQRQRDWERQRKEQAMAERKRHQEAAESLRAVVSDLKFELETLESKKSELVQRISEAKQAVLNSSLSIEAMRHDRDGKLADIDAASRLQVEHEEKLRQLCVEYDHFNVTLQSQMDSRPVADALRGLQMSHSSKKALVEDLRSRMDAAAEESRAQTLAADVQSTELNELKATVSRLAASVSGKRVDVQRSQEAWRLEKQRRARDEAAKRAQLEAAERRAREEEERKKKLEEEQKRRKQQEELEALRKKQKEEEELQKKLQEAAEKKKRDEAEKDANRKQQQQQQTTEPSESVGGWPNSLAFGKGTSAPSAWSNFDGLGTNDSATAKPAALPGKSASNGWGTILPASTSAVTATVDPFGNVAWPALQNQSQPIAFPEVAQTSAVAAAFGSKRQVEPQLLLPKQQPELLKPVGGSAAHGHPVPALVPQQSESSTEPVVRYRVLFDFAARNADELSLTIDDVITVRPEEQAGAEEGWTFGSRGADRGWFPTSYVEVVAAAAPAAASAAPAAAPASAPAVAAPVARPAENGPRTAVDVAATTQPAEKVAGVRMVAKFDWKAKKDNQLSFNKGDVIFVKEQQGAMWLGELRGKEGWIIKDYVMPAPAVATGAAATAGSESKGRESPRLQPPVEPQPQPEAPLKGSTPELACAIYAYSSDEPGDLTFRAGDVITVTSKDGEWWTGTVDGRSGIFPANYVKNMESKPVDDDHRDPLHPKAAPDSQPNIILQPLPPAAAGAAAAAAAAAASAAAVAAEPAIEPSQDSSSSLPMPSAPVAPGQPAKEIGTVIAAYEASGPEQLSLQPNQLIQIRKKSESGWWQGELQVRGQKKKIGWFPKDYVRVLTSGKTTPELILDAVAVTPSSAQQPQLASSASPVALDVGRGGSTTPAAQEPERVIALYPYTATQDDELSFERDAIITILDKEEVEWWRGTCAGRTGMFPANYVQPYVIGAPSAEPVVVQPLTETEKQRQRLIRELMETEEAYVTDMIAVSEVFCVPLFENKMLSKADLDAIFVNWRELIQCNRKLVKAMKVRSKTCGAGNPITVIGDILAENLPNMTAYIRYCSQQLNAAAVLQKRCETDAVVKDFLAKCAQSPKIRGMPLSSYLLKPMQRVTRYPLLIEKIKSCTPADHPDQSYINEALEKAEELASQVNEGVRQKDNSDKLEWIQNHVQCEGLPEKITFNSLTNCLGQRKLLHSGSLQKVRSGKELYAFLFNDFLLLTQPVGGSSSAATKPFGLDAVGITHKMYRTPLFLNELAVKPLPATDKSESEACSFQMSSRHGDRGMELRTTSTTERDLWVKRLQQSSDSSRETEKKGRERTHSLIQQQLSRGIGRILVIVMEGCDLMPKDESGGSDPYCEVSIGGTTQKTKVIPGSLNPKWNSSMQFPIKSVHDDVLCLTVYDEDRYSPNDFLGRTELRIAEILRESKDRRGPLSKRLPLQEVNRGVVVVKLDLQIFGESADRQGATS